MNLRSQSFTLIAFASLAFAAQQTAINIKDWKTFATKDAKFSIKAPKGWGTPDSNDPGMKEAREQFKANNPTLAKLSEGKDNQFELYIIDFGGDPTKGTNNLNLKVLKDSGITPAMYPNIVPQLIDLIKLKKAGWKVVDLPAGKTLTYWGELTIALGDKKTFDISAHGYMTVKDNLTYICTMTTTPEQDKVQKPIFDEMAKSIVLK